MCCPPTIDCLCLQFIRVLKVHYGVRGTVLGEIDVRSVAFYLISQIHVVM